MRGETRTQRLESLCGKIDVGSDHIEKTERRDASNPIVATVLVQTVERGVLLVEQQRETVAVFIVLLGVSEEQRERSTSLEMPRMFSRGMLFVQLSRVVLSYIENIF